MQRKDYIRELSQSPLPKSSFDKTVAMPQQPENVSAYDEAVLSGFKGTEKQFGNQNGEKQEKQKISIWGVTDKVGQLEGSISQVGEAINRIEVTVDELYSNVENDLQYMRGIAEQTETINQNYDNFSKDLNDHKDLTNQRINSTNEKFDKKIIRLSNSLTGIEQKIEEDFIENTNKIYTDLSQYKLGIKNELNGKSDKGHKHLLSDINGLDVKLNSIKKQIDDKVTPSEVKQALDNFYTKSETYSKKEINAKIDGAKSKGSLLIQNSVAWGDITGTLSAQTDLQTALDTKQATLVSGTNIKTVNSSSLLGSGNLAVGDVTTTGTQTLTNKTIALGSNTVSGTKAQFDTAVSDGDICFDGDSVTNLTMSTAKMLGRSTASTGAVEEITVGSGLTLSGGTLSASGGSTVEIWTSLTGTYASTTTFTTTESSNDEATRKARISERSLFTCTDSGGSTRRIGYIKSASASTTTVTYTVVTDTDLASGDTNFKIAYNRKVEDYRHLISVPGEVVADASNSQGVWLLNVKRDSYLLPVNSAVRTAAAGSGAACAWNIYKNTTNLFTSAQDMTTSATFDEKRPNTNTISATEHVSLRLTSSGGATNKASDFQAELFIVPQNLYTGH